MGMGVRMSMILYMRLTLHWISFRDDKANNDRRLHYRQHRYTTILVKDIL